MWKLRLTEVFKKQNKTKNSPWQIQELNSDQTSKHRVPYLAVHIFWAYSMGVTGNGR